MFGFGKQEAAPEDVPLEEKEGDETTEEETEAGLNPQITNPVSEEKNVFVGDVEAAAKAAEGLSLEEESEEEGYDPRNKAA